LGAALLLLPDFLLIALGAAVALLISSGTLIAAVTLPL
jgi:hypothetical protein